MNDTYKQTEEQFPQPPPWWQRRIGVWVGGGVALLLVVAAGSWYLLFGQHTTFTISNIPYVGLHNNIGEYRQPYARNDVSSAIITVLEYWNPGQHDIAEIDEVFARSDFIGFSQMQSFIQNVGNYDARIEELTVKDIADYVNEKTRTPLITLLPLAADQSPALRYFPAVVIVGIDTKQEELTLFSHWYGANYKVSFSQFREMKQLLPESTRNAFMVVQPLDLQEKIVAVGERTTDYATPSVDEPTRRLFQENALATGARFAQQYELAAEYYSRLITSEDFQTLLSPIHRVLALSRFTETLNVLERYEEAQTIGERAVALNHDLDEPFRYLGSYRYLLENNASGYADRLSLPHIVLGDTYRKIGDYQNAREQYEQALMIFPRHEGVREVLMELPSGE